MSDTLAQRCAAVASELADSGVCVQPEFIDADTVAAVAAEARARWREGAFRHARVGTGAQRVLRPEVRSDHVLWIDPGAAPPPIARTLLALDQLRGEINRLTYLGLFDLESHLTVYPPGAFYRRHLDRVPGAAYRVVSCIIYLNTEWSRRDGGGLRLYLDDGAAERVRDVYPLGGTLVTFLSDRFAHEVLPARRKRWSLTGWYRVRGGDALGGEPRFRQRDGGAGY